MRTIIPDERIFICRENGAMVEVFYEQLNFETLKESEAYGVGDGGNSRMRINLFIRIHISDEI